MEFKDKVDQARMQLGLSQTDFAKALGVGFATDKSNNIKQGDKDE